jgi:hypothetical protein
MDLHEHAALSLPAAGAVYLATASAPAALAFAVGGILIDLDHLLDYWREVGWFDRDVAAFMSYFDKRLPIHSWLCLHAWEWPLLALPAFALLGAPAWAWGFVCGMLAHLVLDHRYNRLQPLFYAYLYRWSRRFDSWSFYND